MTMGLQFSRRLATRQKSICPPRAAKEETRNGDRSLPYLRATNLLASGNTTLRRRFRIPGLSNGLTLSRTEQHVAFHSDFISGGLIWAELAFKLEERIFYGSMGYYPIFPRGWEFRSFGANTLSSPWAAPRTHGHFGLDNIIRTGRLPSEWGAEDFRLYEWISHLIIDRNGNATQLSYDS